MADPRNVAHDKKVQDEKKHGKAVVPDASETPQPGEKPTLVQNDSPGDTYQQHVKLHPGGPPEEK